MERRGDPASDPLRSLPHPGGRDLLAAAGVRPAPGPSACGERPDYDQGVSRKALAFTLAAVALVAVVVVGLRQAPETKQGATGGEAHPLDPAAVRAKLAGAPPPLASLHRRANVLLPGSTGELDRQLAAVKGHPAVVNVWAAWCGPCLVEFPAVQQASLNFGRQVAFLGVDYQDNRDRAVRQLSGCR